jgi:hypothetical protein
MAKKHVSLGGANKGNKTIVIDLTLSSSDDEGSDSDDDAADGIEIANAWAHNQVSVPSTTAQAIVASLAEAREQQQDSETSDQAASASRETAQRDGEEEDEGSDQSTPVRRPRRNRRAARRFPHFHKEDQLVKDLLSKGLEPGVLNVEETLEGQPAKRVLRQRNSRSNNNKFSALITARRKTRRPAGTNGSARIHKSNAIVSSEDGEDDVDMDEYEPLLHGEGLEEGLDLLAARLEVCHRVTKR